MHPKTTHSLSSLPPQSDRGENRKSKNEKNFWVKINTAQYMKKKGRKKPKWCKGRVMPSHFLSNTNLSQNLFLSFFFAEHDLTCMEYWVWVSYPRCDPFQFLPTLAYHWGDRVRQRESPDNMQVLLKDSQNTPVLSTLF